MTHVTVARALECTLEAGPAWFAFEIEHRLPELSRAATGPRRSLVSAGGRALGALVKTVGRTALRRVFRPLSAEGVLDLANGRYMMDFGGFAMLGTGQQRCSGRSGRAVSTLPEEGPTMWEPLWLFALLQGATEAHAMGTEPLHGSACRRVEILADVPRAAAACPGDLPLPPAERYSDLLGLPIEVWMHDAERTRRVVLEIKSCALRLDLVDFAAHTELDWSRLPTFRSGEDPN